MHDRHMHRLGAQTFSRRAALYLQCDYRLRHLTHFYAAAALTNAVLRDCVGRWATRRLICAQTVRFLIERGDVLERFNLAAAAHLAQGRESGPGLDWLLIRSEQQLLEYELRRHSALDSLCACRAVAELNRLLAFAVRWGAGFYSGILREVKVDLQSPLDFARAHHRELIGQALTRSVRRRATTSF